MSVLRLRAEDFDEEEAGSDDDAAVGYVEVGPVVVNDMDFDEVDDVMVAYAVVDIAYGSAEDEREGYRGEGDVWPYSPEHAQDNEDGHDGKEDEAVADGNRPGGVGNMLNAAPVLRTWVMRRTPGMTVWALPWGRRA